MNILLRIEKPTAPPDVEGFEMVHEECEIWVYEIDERLSVNEAVEICVRMAGFVRGGVKVLHMGLCEEEHGVVLTAGELKMLADAGVGFECYS